MTELLSNSAPRMDERPIFFAPSLRKTITGRVQKVLRLVLRSVCFSGANRCNAQMRDAKQERLGIKYWCGF
jgi:hypothetical protein